MSPILKVENLYYEYPFFLALKDINFEINEPEIVALVGPNGAGKTTLLRCLAGLELPLRGQVLIEGFNTRSHTRSCHQRIAYLNDFFGLYNDLTVKDSLRYFCYAHGVRDEREITNRIDELTEDLNLADKKEHGIAELSRGMRQRLGIAQSLVHKPKLLLLDEPASGLDPESRMQLGKLLIKLKDQFQMTVIVSSHILAELDQYAQRLVVLRDGKLLSHETIEQVENRSTERICIRLKEEKDLPLLLGHLSNHFGINAMTENHQVIFPVEKNLPDLHEIIRDLVAADFRLSEFFILQNNLQDQYIEMVKQ